MVDKQIYDLNVDDILRCSAWYFPMDDSVDDELTVRPLGSEEFCADAQVIVRASFSGRDGSKYLGYVYWDGSAEVEYLKPVILLEDGTAISFWSGLIKPSWDDCSVLAQNVRSNFPISFASEEVLGFSSIVGELEGLGYLDGESVSWVK